MNLLRGSDFSHLLVAFVGIGALGGLLRWLHLHNPTTVALSFLLVVLFTAAASRLWVAIVTSIVAMLAINFFFLEPVRTFSIADPQNWVALFAFLAVSLVSSRLSSLARNRQREALARRDELARLFELSRDILLSTESEDAIPALARHIARRFDLDYAAVYLPTIGKFDRFEAGSAQPDCDLDPNELNGALDGREPTVIANTSAGAMVLTPLRVGTRAIGLLATIGGSLDSGTRATLASVAAIAIERAHFLEERKQAELSQRSAELKSAVLASLAHDLRTPLTAIRVAADNLRAPWLPEAQRGEQTDIVQQEVARLSRLFQNILEMSTIDSGTIAPAPQWVHPLEIIEAAQHQVEYTLRTHKLDVLDREAGEVVYVDPRLTGSALAHLLENAAHYSPPGSTITVEHAVTAEGLLLSVRDQGVGIPSADLPHLFDRYYRGAEAQKHSAGSGMGLSIARGLLAAQGGRVWAENQPVGARFSLLVPAQHRSL